MLNIQNRLKKERGSIFKPNYNVMYDKWSPNLHMISIQCMYKVSEASVNDTLGHDFRLMSESVDRRSAWRLLVMLEKSKNGEQQGGPNCSFRDDTGRTCSPGGHIRCRCRHLSRRGPGECHDECDECGETKEWGSCWSHWWKREMEEGWLEWRLWGGRREEGGRLGMVEFLRDCVERQCIYTRERW